MKALRFTIVVVGWMLVQSLPGFGQAVAVPALSAAVAAALQPYKQAFAGHSQLYSGPEYRDYTKRYHTRTGHPFFLVPELHASSVYYNDHLFTDVLLAYDLVLDQVVISPRASPLLLRLINENVQHFTLNGHRFVRLVADSASRKVIDTGFYEVLLDSGAVQVLARHRKTMQEHLTQQLINVEFTPVDKLFLQKNGRYYAIRSKGSAVRPLADHAREVQQYLQAHKLRFGRTEREASLVQLAAYYGSLSPR